jgi:ubiquitin carboxyl-terminal hydrolase 10
LEEELLSIVNAISPHKASKGGPPVEEREEEEPPEEDGWMEVGTRNRMVVTRTVSLFAWICLIVTDRFIVGQTAESPITRIFGGKFRSTLRAPQQKDSVVIEDWRALQLDI